MEKETNTLELHEIERKTNREERQRQVERKRRTNREKRDKGT